MKQYNVWTQAYKVNDVATLLKILHPKFVLQTASGRIISRDKYKAGLLKRAKPAPTFTYSTKVTDFRLKKSMAVVLSTETQVETKNGKREGHTHGYLDIWKPYRGQWLLYSSRTLWEK
jgi:hypothetical protein